jgi:HSP20 family molecular chaperone IbpA
MGDQREGRGVQAEVQHNGMTKGDVKVWVEEKMLAIKAEKLPKKGELSMYSSYRKCRLHQRSWILHYHLHIVC